jgi:hypothetical protein
MRLLYRQLGSWCGEYTIAEPKIHLIKHNMQAMPCFDNNQSAAVDLRMERSQADGVAGDYQAIASDAMMRWTL